VLLSSSTPSYRCPFCHADIAVTGYGELAVTLLTLPGERIQRVVEVDGEEVHRCPFVRARYEAVARERAQRLAASPGMLRMVREPQLRLNWYRDG
jgi:hypothetical protein